MKVTRRKWLTDKARQKRARRVTAVKKAAAAFAERMYQSSSRPGFARRFLARQRVSKGELVVLGGGQVQPAMSLYIDRRTYLDSIGNPKPPAT